MDRALTPAKRLGDKKGAQRDRAVGLRERPTDDRSWLARGLARLPDLEAALADFREAYKLNPRSHGESKPKTPASPF